MVIALRVEKKVFSTFLFLTFLFLFLLDYSISPFLIIFFFLSRTAIVPKSSRRGVIKGNEISEKRCEKFFPWIFLSLIICFSLDKFFLQNLFVWDHLVKFLMLLSLWRNFEWVSRQDRVHRASGQDEFKDGMRFPPKKS